MILKMLIGHKCTSHITFWTHYKRLIEYWLGFFDRHVPFATKRTNTNTSPWLNVELKNEMDYIDALQQTFRKSNIAQNYVKYKPENYNKTLLDENTKNATSFWKTLKSIFLTKPKSKLTSKIFKVNEEEISNKEPIANGFGQFFSSIATTQLQTLHPVKEFVLNKLKKWRATPKFSFCLITPSEICNCLKKLWRKHTD